MSCGVCSGKGWNFVPDGHGCVAREPCDFCEAWNDIVQRKANA